MKDVSMEKVYEPKKVEDGIYAAWLESGYFTPENLPNLEKRTESFSIVLPPPNVTGTLHMGHAVMLAVEDAMVRFARMRGKRALWLPGTDHAAIATQSKVEKILWETEEKTRHDVGREDFLQRVDAFAQDSHDTIVNQMKKLGASVDWSREAFTLDDKRNFAVRTAFKRMFDDGLIYRGYRVINWDPLGQTTVSDDEVVHKPGKAMFYTFKYSKDFPIAIATTRPETKVGDTAVAVHPDGAHKEYIGQTFDVEFAGTKLSIKIVGDEAVDPDFGTGALGVTPAHSVIDAGIARSHDLEMRQVIGEDGRMMESAGSLVAGLTTLEARTKIVEWLKSEDLLTGEEEVEQNLSTAERSGGIIEPLPKMQWFIDVNKEFNLKQSVRNPIEGVEDGASITLKSMMQHVVKSGQITIHPNRFDKTYFHWIDNLRDWNISRQIWYGHQVPVWYKGEELACGVDAPEGEGWQQDPDTLDTWFSSGLWTFSTLGWPDENAEDLKIYHPTQVLETGYDILFFWIARMVLMSTYLMGEVPFRDVYLHGLVRDDQGRKMSKSLGNIMNPLDMIEKYGADATRMSLLIGGTPGNDMKLSEEKVEGLRNFTNKLWNISRFVLMNVEKVEVVENVEMKTVADRWIMGRLAQVATAVAKDMEDYGLSMATERLVQFTRNDFADWYIEIAKTQQGESTQRVLLYVLQSILKMLHPFMPFVTEEIWKEFSADLLIVADWPVPDYILAQEDDVSMQSLQEAVTALRELRARLQIPYTERLSVALEAGALTSERAVVEAMVKCDFVEKTSAHTTPVVAGAMTLHVELDQSFTDAARTKLEQQRAKAEGHVKSLEARLQNVDYVKSAPEAVVQATRDSLAEAERALDVVKKEIEQLN
jgi:valyl-tRNA synthetase